MIKVVGASPEKIELRELNDKIYYKQEKSFSEIDYRRSHTLRHAINLGKIIVLERTPDNKEFGVPPISEVSIAPINECPTPIVDKSTDVKHIEVSASEDKLDLLLRKISSLEDRINKDSEKIVADSNPLDIILNRLKQIEDKLSSGVPTGTDDSQLMQSIRALEEKINQGQSANVESLLKRLEETVSKVGYSSTREDKDSFGGDTIYVPSVTVEDANSHINLKVRTVEKSDTVNSALEALKKIKDKFK